MGILFPVTSLKNFFPLAENAKIAEDKISSMMKYSWRSRRLCERIKRGTEL